MKTENFIRMTRFSCAYNEVAKKAFHREAGKVLKALAEKLGYAKADYDLRHNQGGIAVSGEITLHSDNLYVQFSQSALRRDHGFMWRTCKGRKDYTGGLNRWMQWEKLTDLDEVARTMKTTLDAEKQFVAQQAKRDALYGMVCKCGNEATQE